jgi:5-formyltetrahydrofolate cyclo-ligase
VPPGLRAGWSRSICAQALSLSVYRSARTVHIFLSFQSEVDTQAIIEDALACGKRVVVPVFVRGSDEAHCSLITSLDESAFDFGAWGLRTPKNLRFVPPDEIDLVFVPLVAYSPLPGEKGVARIGYGAGYYDRFLGRLRPGVPRIGLAFSLQRADAIPVAPHDVLLDEVITER